MNIVIQPNGFSSSQLIINANIKKAHGTHVEAELTELDPRESCLFAKAWCE